MYQDHTGSQCFIHAQEVFGLAVVQLEKEKGKTVGVAPGVGGCFGKGEEREKDSFQIEVMSVCNVMTKSNF